MYDKGDYRINGGMGLTFLSPAPTYDIQGAYALSKHFALMANGSLKSGKEYDGGDASYQRLYEMGGGYYNVLGQKERGRIEFFSGYGRGKSRLGEKGEPEETASFSKVFFQPSIGFRSREVDLSIGSRTTIVNFTDRVLGFTTQEFFGQIGLGYENVRCFGQISFGLPVSGSLSYSRVNEVPAILMLNFGVSISPWKEWELYPEEISESTVELIERNITQLKLPASEVKFCLQSPSEYPDVDLVEIIYNGSILTKKVRPEKEPDCFNLILNEEIENALLIRLVSDGMKEGCIIQLSFSAGNKEEFFYLNPSFDRIEEIRLNKDGQ